MADTTKLIKRERKRGADMNSKLVESSLEQDFKVDRRHKKGKEEQEEQRGKQQW